MTSERPRLYLIDGFSNIFRAYYAIRSLSNSRGLPTNATYGFLQMLRKLLRDASPELIGVALDVSEETVRKEKYADYKANRPEMPEDLVPQLPWIRKTLDAMHIPILELEGYEADDVLGTLANKAELEGYDVVLISADKDLMQLVTDHVNLYHTGRDKLYGPAEVEEDFGVPPAEVVDVLALTGDSVDNVPGVKGIGKKGAVQLVKQFGALESLLEHADEVDRKSYREGLKEHRDEALLSKELVTIHRDLPIDFDPVDLSHEPPDREALAAIAAELDFHSLLKEMSEPGDSTAAELPLRSIATADTWRTATEGVGPRLVIALAVAGDPVGLAVATGSGSVLWADMRLPELGAAVRKTLIGWLSSDEMEIAGHDLKPVLKLAGATNEMSARLVDSMLTAYLLRPATRNLSLEGVALDRLGVALATAEEVGLHSADQSGEPGEGEVAEWAAARVVASARLRDALEPELDRETRLRQVYDEIEEPLIPVLARMEAVGVLLDVPFLEGLSEEFGAEIGELEQRIFEQAGHEFNLNSPRQLGEVMFEELGYPVIKKTRKTKSFSTDAETLEELANRGLPMALDVLRYRELAKLKSTYVDALPALVDSDNRLHTDYQQAVAATGRLSSANPNLQNIPVRTEDGRRIRRAFIAPPSRQLLVADYSQIELRVLAHIAQEETLIEAFQQGRDIHAATAASVFGVAPDLVSADQRRAAKVINFGILYGMSAFGLSRNLGIPRADAQRFIDAYLDRYPKVREYIDRTLETAEETGRVETMYGRVRWLPELTSKNFAARENARRMAINAPIQGTAADLLKLAMIRVDTRLRKEHPDCALLLTVHDELVLEVETASVEPVEALVRDAMQGVAELSVPLVVDTGVGPNWYDAKE